MLVEILSTGTLITHIGLLALSVFLLVERFSSVSRISNTKKYLFSFMRTYYRELAFLQALVAVSGSMYLSEFVGIAPCELCWYQRVLIFPTVLLIGVALFLDKEDLADYIISLMALGLPLSLYHYFVQMTQASTGCSTAVSCSTTQILEYGYITVPMMSITFFLTMILFMVFEYREE